MNSKPLKPFELDTLPFWQDNKFYNLVWRVYRKLVGRPLEKLEHDFSYLKVLQHDYDFEAHSVYSILHHKLSRVRMTLQNGHSIQEDRTMKSLDLAIHLADKLYKDDYNSAYSRYEKKWGELETWTTPVPGDTSVYWYSRRKNAIYLNDKEQERRDFRDAVLADEVRKTRDRKIFFNILAKYLMYWWD